MRFAALALVGLAPACVEKSSDAPSAKDLQTIKENILTTAPTPKHPANTDFDGKITFLGVDVDKDAVAPGDTFVVKSYFKVVNPTGSGWKLFMHLNGDKGGEWQNFDHVPIKGKYQVSKWKAGEIIRDEHKITVPKGWHSSSVTVYVGIYKGGDRMKVVSGEQDGQNRAVAVKLPLSGSAQSSAAPPAMKLPELLIKKAKKAPVIDGKLDDEAWATATSTGQLVETLQGGKTIEPPAEVKALWDDKYLYFAFSAKDEDVQSQFTKHDDKLWTEDVFEVFLDPDGDGKTYVELQVNPNNATFDSWLPERRQNNNDWTAEGMKTAVQVDGTVNKHDDQDKGWTAEMAIPWSAVAGKLDAKALHLPPSPGFRMRGNLFRFDLRKDGKEPVGAAWSPTIEPDFHNTARFGVFAFADENGNIPAPPEPAMVGPHGDPLQAPTKLTPAQAAKLVRPEAPKGPDTPPANKDPKGKIGKPKTP
jgi:hypothetical protein